MPLRLIRNDITKTAADAIVNTANPRPVIGAGTDSAVHAAAGPELLAARQAVGDIAPGCCAATPAFALPARYVLHAVTPFWIDGRHGEEEALRRTYDAALALAERLQCQSVAFPLLAAGSCGYPRELALSVAIAAFTDFLMEHEMTILLTLYNREAFGLAGSLFDDLKSYIDDRYVEQHAHRWENAESARDRRRPVSAAHPMADSLEKLSKRREKAARQEAAQADAFLAADEACGERPASSGSPDGSVSAAMSAPVGAAMSDASLIDWLRQHETTFSEYLMDLLRERSGKDSEVYKRAEVSKQLFSKILSTPDYRPTKSTAIQLAIGLQLDMEQTRKLLEKAGYALTRSSKADLVVQYYIERGIYSVTFINEALYDCGLPLLKTGLKS